MKKVVFFILLLSCCGWLMAQKAPINNAPNGNKKMFFGLSFGPTIDWFAPTTTQFELTRNKPKAGLIAGVDADFSVINNRMLYFSTGVLFRYLQGELSFMNNYSFHFPDIPYTRTFSTTRTYQTMYIVIPTGLKFRTLPSRNCVFAGKIGLYHGFKVGGNQVDNFTFPGLDLNPEYYITTRKIENKDASLFAESGYFGLGFEYVFAHNIRITTDVNYACQFNYFNSRAINNVSNERYRSIVHSLNIVFGVLF